MTSLACWCQPQSEVSLQFIFKLATSQYENKHQFLGTAGHLVPLRDHIGPKASKLCEAVHLPWSDSVSCTLFTFAFNVSAHHSRFFVFDHDFI